MAISHAFTSEPRRVSNPRKARSTASCTTSSASPGAYDNHRANLYAASRCGNTCASNRARFSSMDAKTHGRRILFPASRSCPQKQVILDGYELVGGANQRCGGEFSEPIDLDRHAILVADFVHQQIKIAVTRSQHRDIRLRRVFEDVQSDADVPIAFCGAVVSLDEGSQFHLETYRAQDILKLLLLGVIPIDRECDCFHDRPAAGALVPKLVVVKMARKALPRSVVDILHIDEDSYGFHGISSQTQEVGNCD